MRGEFAPIAPLTYIVKRLIWINAVSWVVLVLIVQKFFMQDPNIFEWFGFVPFHFFRDFWIWQPLTYMFLHSDNVSHVVLNMILLWWLGSELELHWGRRYFLFYYIACGIGAALIYLVATLTYYFITGRVMQLQASVVGASGAIFGLIVAYGIIFGDRVVYFMMMFPMKARHFVMIVGGVELMYMLSQGFSSDVSNLAHLGGIITGYLILRAGPRIRDLWLRRQTRAHGRRLKLVVDNSDRKANGGPRYWN